MDSGGNGQAPTLTLRVPAAAEWVRVVRLMVGGVAGPMAFSADDIEDIKLAVAEACNNAILHGGGPDKSTTPSITVEVTPHPDRLEISVADEGRAALPGLRPESGVDREDAGSLIDDLPEGGLGLMLIQSLMDQVTHPSGADANTTLRMVKHANATVPDER